jgi:hypothetical protein
MKIPDKNRGKPVTIESVYGFHLSGSFLLSHPFKNGCRHPLATILLLHLNLGTLAIEKPGRPGLLIIDDNFWRRIRLLFSKNTHFCFIISSIFAD